MFTLGDGVATVTLLTITDDGDLTEHLLSVVSDTDSCHTGASNGDVALITEVHDRMHWPLTRSHSDKVTPNDAPVSNLPGMRTTYTLHSLYHLFNFECIE